MDSFARPYQYLDEDVEMMNEIIEPLPNYMATFIDPTASRSIKKSIRTDNSILSQYVSHIAQKQYRNVIISGKEVTQFSKMNALSIMNERFHNLQLMVHERNVNLIHCLQLYSFKTDKNHVLQIPKRIDHKYSDEVDSFRYGWTETHLAISMYNNYLNNLNKKKTQDCVYF